jgi:hypothetical protein
LLPKALKSLKSFVSAQVFEGRGYGGGGQPV